MKKQRTKKVKKTKGLFGIILASLSALVSSSLIVIMTLTALDYINLIPEYVKVNFYGDNDQLLQTKEVLEFSPVEYDGPVPVKSPGPKGPYIFLGWDRNLKNVWRNTNTHAIFVPTSFFEGGGVGDLPDDIKFQKNTVMKIKSNMPGITYLKYESFGNYNSGSWTDAPKYEGNNLKPLDKTFTNPNNYAGYISSKYSKNIKYPFEIQYLSSFYHNPIPTYLNEKVSFTGSDSYFDGLIKANTFQGTASLIEPIHFPDTLNVLRNVNLPPDMKKEFKQYREYAKKNYLDVPKKVYPLVKSFVERNNIKSSDNAVFANVSRAINEALEFEVISSSKRDKYMDPLNQSFEITKKGNVTIYASMTTLMLRYLGIPARYCTGYLGAVLPNQVNQFNDIDNLQVSNWCEAFVDNVGWITVDPLIDEFLEMVKNNQKPGGAPDDNNIDFDFDLNLPPNAKYIEKIYDAEPFKTEDIIILDDKTIKRLEALKLTVDFDRNGRLDEFSTVGTKAFRLKPRLYDESNKDVTENYAFDDSPINVVLRIKPKPLLIKIEENKEAVFNGGPYYCNYEYFGLLPGYELFARTDGYTDPGEYEVTIKRENIQVLKIDDFYQEDYSNNYDIKIKNGSLIIYEED